MKGLIALDIDGTTVAANRAISNELNDFFAELIQKHWTLLFVTGRSFYGSHRLLSTLRVPYYLAVHNGAIILEMPHERIVSKKYLSRDLLSDMDIICDGEPSDFVIFSGYEYKDLSFYRPDRFSEPLLTYLHKRVAALQETWRPIVNFEDMDIEGFPSLKCFGTLLSAKNIAARIESTLKLHVPVIRDPFDPNFYVVQGTHPEVNKGQAVQDLLQIISPDGLVIAAGDDYNDCPMWEKADIKIVMATAPQELLRYADVIAPPAEQQGIIAGLQQALNIANKVV